MTSRPPLLFAIALLTAAFAAKVLLLTVAANRLGVDFAVFARVQDGTAALYEQYGPMPFLYPPSAIAPFWVLTKLPYWAFTAISAAFFFWSVARVSGWSTALASFASQAAIKGLTLGQIPMLLTSGLFIGLTLPPLWGGALWGAVAAVKPQLMLFAPLALLVRRDYGMLCGMALGGLVAGLLSLTLFGPGIWAEWISAMDWYSTRLDAGVAIKSVTPAGIAAVSGYSALPAAFAGLFLGAGAVIVAARRVEKELLIGLIVAAGLAASPYAHIHDAIALIPACVALMLRGRLVLAIPAALVFFGTPLLTSLGLLWALVAIVWLAAREGRSRDAVPAV